jgi:formylmethanofuran dehydrogenase subunit C
VIKGRAQVGGRARVTGQAMVSGDAVVKGDNVWIVEAARIGGTAVILGGSWNGSEGEVTEGTWIAPGYPELG